MMYRLGEAAAVELVELGGVDRIVLVALLCDQGVAAWVAGDDLFGKLAPSRPPCRRQ